ncbi:MAG: UvrD-helicase domain-containing protein [Acidobacteria bacterium]|nr:UvrD-helicase domain-containing protein [Acidobacteriota bacterium]
MGRVMLKEEQRLAAFTLDRHVSVTAGPGAGKTRVLVERYLHILATQEIAVDQIVALTFTNHAAHEMRHRLRAELEERLRSATPEQRAKWINYKRTLDGSIITTIHGFCARLLREFPVEAKVDPQFLLLEGHQSALLLEGIVESALTQLISSDDDAVLRLAAGYGRANLVAAMMRIYRELRDQGLSIDRVIEATQSAHRPAEDLQSAVSELDGRMREFLSASGLPPGAEGKRAAAEAAWPSLLDLLRAEPGSRPLVEIVHPLIRFRSARPSARGNLAGMVRELDELIWAEKLSGRVPRLYFDQLARAYAVEILHVLGTVEQRLAEEKQRLQALDFDDLQVGALELLRVHPEVIRRIGNRYRFFLIDEFQDTNGLQRDLLQALALSAGRQANIFIVGDRKQSIYGFRGADVDVFREMTGYLENRGGITVPLHLNFRSQPHLIGFFNHLFAQVFRSPGDVTVEELGQLGFVEHEPGVDERPASHPPPLVELMVVDGSSADRPIGVESAAARHRERAARQVARSILECVGRTPASAGRSEPGTAEAPKFTFGQIAILFRAMTHASTYEIALRRAGIPFVTLHGKGFYQREEITDLIQLLRFLDNQTDDLALAAVLRSPLCGLSDHALLALRCAPTLDERWEVGRLRRRRGVRNLRYALRHHARVSCIDSDERPVLDAADRLLAGLIEKRQRESIAGLLRNAIDASELRTVVAANFDGAQRLANIEKLLGLAGRFERAGTQLIRDFVRYVLDFEKAGGREGEEPLDVSADVVRLMTIHQSKGLEFPVVIIPELHSRSRRRTGWHLLDRHWGLSIKVPDGLGRALQGATFDQLRRRAYLRDQFESMRLFYVAATRAQDRLVLSGVVNPSQPEESKTDDWLSWVGSALGLESGTDDSELTIDGGLSVRIQWDRETGETTRARLPVDAEVRAEAPVERESAAELDFPLLAPIRIDQGGASRPFTVTQLLNFQRCPRQFYFDRRLHVPGDEVLAFWNDAEAPEPPANLTATLRGSVIHRFCETFEPGEDPIIRLRRSLAEVLRAAESEWGERVREIDQDEAVRDLTPLARNYLESEVRRRVERSRSTSRQGGDLPPGPGSPGVYHELPFQLRRPQGTLKGSIDKLLLYENARPDRSGMDQPVLPPGRHRVNAEVIDFKTNRPGRSRTPGSDLIAEIEQLARDYLLQMQAYILAVHELLPEVERVKGTLHFLAPDMEFEFPAELVSHERSAAAIDDAMSSMIRSLEFDECPARPEEHCRYCSFLQLCRPGRQWTFRRSL